MPDYQDSEAIFLPEEGMRRLTVQAVIRQGGRPFAFLKHQNFLQFSEFGYESPIYMNFVRHPVERIISWYYYVRAPWYQVEEDERYNVTFLKTAHGIKIKDMKMTLEECLDRAHAGCVIREGASVHTFSKLPSHASQMAFFCGHDHVCDTFNAKEMYQRALQNVEKYFAVVGVLEDLEESLAVLEHFIPRYFAGSREVFAANSSIRHVNKNIYKPPTPSHVKARIAANMTREIQFYHFCRQRLHKQFLSLGE